MKEATWIVVKYKKSKRSVPHSGAVCTKLALGKHPKKAKGEKTEPATATPLVQYEFIPPTW